MELKQLEYMIMAADLGSFNKASELLYTTQSNVSKVIRNLEKELGYPIFKRQGNGVSLTEAGHELYEESLQIVAMMKKIENSNQKIHSGCFHIASVISNYIAGCFTSYVIANQGKDICFKMWDGDLSYVIDLVSQGDAEMGFLYINKKAEESFQRLIHRKGLHFHEISAAQIEICVGPGHPFYERKDVDPVEMLDLRFIRLFEDQISKTYHLNDIEKSLGLSRPLQIELEVDSAYALMNLLARTDLTHLCYGNIEKPHQNGLLGIRTIPVNISEEVVLGYIHPWDATPTQRTEDFISYLLK